MSNDVSLDVNNNLRVVNYHVSCGLSPRDPQPKKDLQARTINPYVTASYAHIINGGKE